MVLSTRKENQIATDSLKGQKAKRGLAVAAGADGNGRDRSVFTWRDCVLAEAVKGCGSLSKWKRVKHVEHPSVKTGALRCARNYVWSLGVNF